MRCRSASLILSLVAIILLPTPTWAQRGRVYDPPSTAPFDPQELSGVWWKREGSREFGSEPGQQPPPFTPDGQARFDANLPGYGPRAVPPAIGNDPFGACNPDGLARILLFNRPVEFIQLEDKLIQFFQYHRVLREAWTDGREMPSQPDIPRWYGYSVGHWEDDTFVVDSYGFDDRQWLDNLGYPISDELRLQERYRRTAFDRMEMTIIVNDPKTYTAPWVSQTKTWHLLTDTAEYSAPGWNGLMEELCVPLDEVDQFNRRVRDPAGGVTGP